MNILVLIPAKLDSKRLPKKNIQLINDKPLVEYSIDFAKNSRFNPRIILSSESSVIEDIASNNKVEFLKRSPDLCGDVEVVDVYLNILNSLDEKFDLVVALQPDHPDREYNFDYYIDYFVENNYDDLITIEPNFKRSGSVRIFKYDHIMNGHVSKRIGCLKDDATDIHYQEDLIKATKKINDEK
jgi:CMP-N-acetylneuraminic acid synthetase